MCSLCSADLEQDADSRIQALVLWERKIDEYFLHQETRYPSATHEFTRIVIFFEETRKIIHDVNSRQKYLDLLTKRIGNPAEIFEEHQRFYGFFYCVLAQVDYGELLSKNRANDSEINQVVIDVLILGKDGLSERRNFMKTKAKRLELED